MTKRRSIGEKLKRSKSPEAKLNTALQWAAEWYNEQDMLVQRLKNAVEDNDKSQILFNLRQLDAVTQKRHDALTRVMAALSESVLEETEDIDFEYD